MVYYKCHTNKPKCQRCLSFRSVLDCVACLFRSDRRASTTFCVMWVYLCNIFTGDERKSCFWNEAGRVGQKDLGEFSSWSEPQAVCNENVSSLLSGFLQLPCEDVHARLNSAESNYPEGCRAGVNVAQRCPLLDTKHLSWNKRMNIVYMAPAALRFIVVCLMMMLYIQHGN